MHTSPRGHNTLLDRAALLCVAAVLLPAFKVANAVL